MGILNIVGFETGTGLWEGATGGTTVPQVQSGTVRTGGYALECSVATTGNSFYTIQGLATTGLPASLASNTDRYLRFYFNAATLPASLSEEICQITGAVGRGITPLRVRINSAGNLLAYNGLSLIATGTTVLSTGTWYRIEVKRLLGTTATWEIKINGTSELTGSTNFGGSTGSTILLGKVTNQNGKTVDFFYDDVCISDSAYPGAGQCSILLPVGAGNYQTWTIGAGSGSNWQQVDERPPDVDTTYLLSPLIINDFETEALTDSVASGTINCAKSIAILKQNVAGGTVRVALRSGATDDITSADYTATASYVGISKLYPTDPATGSAWVASALDSVEAGAKCTSAVNQVRMTFCAVMVDYNPSAAGPPIGKLFSVPQAVQAASSF